MGWYSNMPKLARLRERKGGRPVDAKSHLRQGMLLGPLLNRASTAGIGPSRDKKIQRVSEEPIPPYQKARTAGTGEND